MSTSSEDSIMELLLLDSSSSSDSDSVNESSNIKELHRCKDRVNYMEILNDYEFMYRFRLNKTAVNALLLDIYPFLRVTSSRNHGIAPLHQLLLTLRFYAVGTMLVSVADFVGVSKTSASRIIRDISFAIAKLYPKYVKFHVNTQKNFYQIANFPKVLGLIDGTHIAIQFPDYKTDGNFKNKNGYYSINVQAVCDAELMFMHIIANSPGSTHDSTIFNNSPLKEECEENLFGDRWLLGDNAYPCTNYLLTPISAPTNQNEMMYNEAHIKTWNTIERCFEVWKRRFPVLTQKIRLALDTTETVIIATGVLHNICRQLDLQDMEPEVQIADAEDMPVEAVNDARGSSNRSALIDYFSRL